MRLESQGMMTTIDRRREGSRDIGNDQYIVTGFQLSLIKGGVVTTTLSS